MPEAIEIIGIERDLIQNQHYGIIFADNELFLEVISNYELAESDNQAQVVKNVPFKSFNDSIHTLDTTITPVYDKNKDRSGYILSFDDISDMQKVKTTFKKYKMCKEIIIMYTKINMYIHNQCILP